MGAKRKWLAVLVALALAPGTFLRSEVVRDYGSPVTMTELAFEAATSGPLSLEGVWQLSSENDWFGGYSALESLPDRSFLAASDRGRLLEIPMPSEQTGVPQITSLPGFPRLPEDRADVEALAIDPATGRSWVAIETNNRIRRFSPSRPRHSHNRPEAMKHWPLNAGAESMVRMPGGRFLVIAEADMGGGRHRGLLFSGDPVESDEVTRFVLEGEEGYTPSDAARLPDGRVVVILRKLAFGWPYSFKVRLAVFDPAMIRRGATIGLRQVATIDTPFPTDNYEGITVTSEDGGDWIAWMISDDNFNRYQRTLLLKLRWARNPSQTRQKARR
ncbi:esterase-like activity of phytase family protein [Qipengyuania sphaerica]|uniref:esterase-like activity of phytase family protein n=1 Tax=Qipengyuania sphaerica TaxID=2867243 RepID=UPI001C887348|nr:esterase-like activity of phytase family protein [Qipengyuania sphaerica]MBX7541588.1 esterase-like activity of phytase family protein [Qipengyuania sphaerica]